MYLYMITLTLWASGALGQGPKCDHTPAGATVPYPSDNEMPYTLYLSSKSLDSRYVPDQTYVLVLETKNLSRPFREFMITAEDPSVDNIQYGLNNRNVDVGILKTLAKGNDNKARYSERCFATIENNDYSNKVRIEAHWVSPKNSQLQKIRFRAMVAENKEVWYEGQNLTVTLDKDDAKPPDSPPLPVLSVCNLCSEARYEMIFKGEWSRGTHPRHYPTRPDENGYSHVIGASHDTDFTLWMQGSKAAGYFCALAEDANSTAAEEYIVKEMSPTQGTRTLIRGKRRHHPHMSEPVHALFRVDRYHHLFSIAVAMKPSPDWFLGASKFELCQEDEWLPHAEIPLFPWDAGTIDGISYDSPKERSQQADTIERVAVGSFNKDSPFFQMNLNDMKPFATLKVRRLNVYPLVGDGCGEETEEKAAGDNGEEDNEDQEEPQDEPLLAEWRQERQKCLSEWSEWSPCKPLRTHCGIGFRRRVRFRVDNPYANNDPEDLQVKPLVKCITDEQAPTVEKEYCNIDC